MKSSRCVELLKRTIDLVIGTIGTLSLLLVGPVVALCIKLDSRGPVLYRQQRVGLNRRRSGRDWAPGAGSRLPGSEGFSSSERRDCNVGGQPFVIYKFRTMVVDAESSGPRLCAKQGDARLTRVGRWLRVTHLDELPQFVQVLFGQMSFVGPRPERPFFTARYLLEVTHYAKRTALKPGLTGIAQIALGYDESPQSIVAKARLDGAYVQACQHVRAWLVMEAWILWGTLAYLLGSRGKQLRSVPVIIAQARLQRLGPSMQASLRAASPPRALGSLRRRRAKSRLAPAA